MSQLLIQVGPFGRLKTKARADRPAKNPGRGQAQNLPTLDNADKIKIRICRNYYYY